MLSINTIDPKKSYKAVREVIIPDDRPNYGRHGYGLKKNKAKINFGLSYLKENQSSYFSVTVDGENFGGCYHDLVLELAPDLEPFVDLHLSNCNGVPCHAEANGSYWVESYFELGRYRDKRSKNEILKVIKSHFRSDPQAILDEVVVALKEENYFMMNGDLCTKDSFADPIAVKRLFGEAISTPVGHPTMVMKIIRQTVNVICERLTPQWNAEANEALKILAKELSLSV